MSPRDWSRSCFDEAADCHRKVIDDRAASVHRTRKRDRVGASSWGTIHESSTTIPHGGMFDEIGRDSLSARNDPIERDASLSAARIIEAIDFLQRLGVCPPLLDRVEESAALIFCDQRKPSR